MQGRHSRLFCSLLLLFVASIVRAQLSVPIAKNADLTNSKYRAREPIDIDRVMFGVDGTKSKSDSTCRQELDILWTHELSYSVYTAPLIYDLFSDGEKDVMAATFVRSVEALRAGDGAELPGWPVSLQESYFHSSPLPFDFDKDGIMDYIFTTANGEVIFVREDGTPFFGETLKVPPLEVRKDWFVGLEDVGSDAFSSFRERNERKQRDAMKKDADEDEKAKTAEQDITTGESNSDDDKIGSKANTKKLDQGDAGKNRHHLFESSRKKMTDKLTITLDEDWDRRFQSAPDTDPLYSRNYAKYFNKTLDDEMAYVDPHVLSTPVLCDLDNDGGRDLVIAVSYYYDTEYYSDPLNLIKLPSDIDITKYLGGGIVVFDLDAKTLKFSVHLDLTTTQTTYRSYIYSSPSVADLNRDGRMEILIGTSLGFIYALDHDGKLQRGFPLEMSEIQATLTLVDVNGDGNLDFIGMDRNSNIVAYNYRGEEIWDSTAQGFASQAAAIGDIDGDGQIDIVFGTDTGLVWAIRADNGKPLSNFPLKTGGKILAPVSLIRLDPKKKEPHVVVSSFDGYIYIIDGKTGCFDRIDVGETSFSMVLADDLNDDGKLDLVASTMNGNIFVFGTQMPYHPLNTIHAGVDGGNVFGHKETFQGIYIQENNRYYRDIKGDKMILEFEIVDQAPRQKGIKRRYEVAVYVGGKELHRENITKPGAYAREISVPPTRSVSTLQLSMKNANGQVYSDLISLSFNVRFYKTFKWLLVGPFVVVVLVMLLVRDFKATPLPV